MLKSLGALRVPGLFCACLILVHYPFRTTRGRETVMVDLDFQKSREADAIRYLKKVETPEEYISADRDDYDAYWIFLIRKTSLIPEEQGLHRRNFRYKVGVGSGGWVTIQLTKDAEDDPENRVIRLTSSWMAEAEFEVTHYFRGLYFPYTTPRDAAKVRRRKLHVAKWLWARFKRSIVERKATLLIKSISERKTVLDAVMEVEDKTAGKIFSSANCFEVHSRLHGKQLEQLPASRRFEEFNRLARILDSLVESGELKKKRDPLTYESAPKAIASSIEWGKDIDRVRHQERREMAMVLITLIIALATVGDFALTWATASS